MTAGVSVEGAMERLPYEGFKLHSCGNTWDLDDPRTLELTAFLRARN